MTTLTIHDTTRALSTAVGSSTSLNINIAENILFEIALWTYSPNETISAYLECLPQIVGDQIKQTYHIDLPIDIIKVVVQCLSAASGNYPALKWTKCNKDESDRLLEFSNNDAMVRYRDPTPRRNSYRSTIVGNRDYVIVRSAHCLQTEQRTVINCYVKSVGDEMWIGLMTESGYAHDRSLRTNPHALTFYNSGRFHSFGSNYYRKQKREPKKTKHIALVIG